MSGPRRGSGLLIAIEGIDGSGKSTLARDLVGRIRRAGGKVRAWREPTDPELGRLAVKNAVRDPAASALYFTIDRIVARPRLERLLRSVEVVVSDRSFYSTLAYQGSAVTPIARRRIAEVQRDVAISPDRVILLRLDPKVALLRIGKSRKSRASIENLATLRRVDLAYRRLARGRNWMMLDATLPRAAVGRQALARLGPALSRRRRARRKG